MKKQEVHIFKGMQQDLDVARQSADFLRDAHNIRFVQEDGSNLLVISNEKSTKRLTTNKVINGTYVGHCVINNWLVVFTTAEEEGERVDRIYVLTFQGGTTFNVKVLFEGSLGFSEDTFVSAVGIYETSSVVKVYWVDGEHEVRMANIMMEEEFYTNPNQFSFVPTLKLDETITVTTNRDGGGLFPAGTIQYAFAYFNKNSAQSKIFYTTPLHYVIGEARGLSPEAKGSCSFTINITDADDFDYVRIYAIQRTSINAVPAVRYIDRPIEVTTEGGTTTRSLTYTDFNLEGSSMDPQELLYVGGSQLVSNVINIKDNTLFLGGYTDLKDEGLDYDKLKEYNLGQDESLECTTRTLVDRVTPSSYYEGVVPKSDNMAGFKSGEVYHFGLQVQDSSGEWSIPIPIYKSEAGSSTNSYEETLTPQKALTAPDLEVPCFKLTLGTQLLNTFLSEAGYNQAVKVRPVMIAPSWSTRKVLAQCVVCPTIDNASTTGARYQSSWFFRPQVGHYQPQRDPGGTYQGEYPQDYNIDNNLHPSNNIYGAPLEWRHNHNIPYPEDVMGSDPYPEKSFVPLNAEMPFYAGYKVNWQVVTLHSPEFEFLDDIFSNISLQGTKLEGVGGAIGESNRADMEVEVSTPPIGVSATVVYTPELGFHYIYQDYSTSGWGASVFSGPMYYDRNVHKDGDNYGVDTDGGGGVYSNPWWFFIYPWQASRSLNNDCNRPNQSARLSRKKLYNFKTYNTEYKTAYSTIDVSSYESSFINFAEQKATYIGNSGLSYLPNVDTLVLPDSGYNGKYPLYAYFPMVTIDDDLYPNNKRVSSISYMIGTANGGEDHVDVSLKLGTESIRMKYKSTPHMVVSLSTPIPQSYTDDPGYDDGLLPIVDIVRSTVPELQSENNLWIPVGEPVKISSSGNIELEIIYGDTWYTRYDCLKTYPFSLEDENCIVEIGSFMLETRVNLDGRYDGNIGKGSLVTTPQIFNLLNPVYSQEDNFFTYRMQDPLYETVASHPNTVLWSREKQLGEVVDTFASITPASSYDLDGKLGEITALFNQQDYLYAFQEYGLSHLLFNSRVQIPVSDGAPVEITNSKKMEGFRVISDAHGLFDKQSLAKSPAGTYFINSTDGDLFIFSDNRITNIGSQKGMGSWIKSMLDTSETNSTNTSTSNTSGGGSTGGDNDITRPNPRPRLPRKRRQTKGSDTFTRTLLKLLYDKNTGDLYVDTGNEFLDFQESIGQFTSFLDYKDVNALASFTDNSIILAPSAGEVGLYKMFSDSFTDTEGYYNRLLETNVVPSLEFISNSEPLADKIFTNLDARADFYNKDDDNGDVLDHNAFFNSIRVWNEYQDTGDVPLTHLVRPQGTPKVLYSNTKKKFRTWRLDIPRAFDFDNNKRLLDRIRNHWTHIKLTMALDGTHKRHFNLHDIGVTYYV